MDNLAGDLGKIFAEYNSEIDDFDLYRVTQIKKDDDGNTKYFIDKLKDYHLPEDNIAEGISSDEFKEFKKNKTALKSDGVISITNIVSVENEFKEIRDILLLFFPNNRVTGVPDIHNPAVLARQGVNNIFSDMGGDEDQVGVSLTLESLPAGYSFIDFMEHSRTLDSVICNVYKTDSASDIAFLLHNDTTDEILSDLFNHRLDFIRNTDLSFNKDEEAKYIKAGYIDGYCSTLSTFLIRSCFMLDFYNTLGITLADFPLESGKALDQDEMILLSTEIGGIKINKAVPIKFGYDINMSAIKMKYLLVLDNQEILWIVPYTEFENEIDAEPYYKLTEERTNQIQERLRAIVEAYDGSVKKI